MPVYQKKSRKKATGGLYADSRKSRKFLIGGRPTNTTVGEKKHFQSKGIGNTRKLKLVRGETAVLTDPETKKSKKAKIVKVLENRANPHFVRLGIITKGTIIDTDAGKAKVTSRPGQDGQINAVLIGK